MAWPTPSADILFQDSLTGSPTTWAQAGDDATASATLVGSVIIEDGGFRTTSAGNYWEFIPTTGCTPEANGLTIAIRFFHGASSDPGFMTSMATFFEDTGSNFPQLLAGIDEISGNWGPKAQTRNSAGTTISRTATSAAESDQYEVVVCRWWNDGGTWRLTQTLSTGAGTTGSQTGSVPEPGLTFDTLYIGSYANQTGIVEEVVNGVAIWYEDIGAAAAEAITPDDAEWSATSATNLTAGVAGVSATAVSPDLSVAGGTQNLTAGVASANASAVAADLSITPVVTIAGGTGVKVLASEFDGTPLGYFDGVAAEWESPLNDVGVGRITVPRDDEVWSTDWAPSLLVDEDVYLTFILDGVQRHTIIVTEIDEGVAEPDGEAVVVLAGPGIAAALDWGTVLPTTYPGNQLSQTVDFVDAPAMTIFQTLFDSADSRGVSWRLFLPWTAPLDSDGVTLTDSQTEEITPGGGLLGHLRRLTFLAGVDWAATPTGSIEIRKDWGTDRSGSVRLEVGYAVESLGRRHNRRDVRNALYLEGKEGLISADTDATSVSTRGRREAYISAGTAMNTATRDAYLEAALEIAANPSVEYDVTVSPEDFTPYVDADIGDTIKIYDSTSGIDVAVRILGIAYAVDTEGRESLTLTLSSRLRQRLTQLSRALETLDGLTDIIDASIQFPAPVKLVDTIGELDTDQIAAGAITETELAPDAVSTPKLQANAVTADILASNSVVTDSMVAGSIDGDRITGGTLTVTSAEITNLTVDKLLGGTITGEEIILAGVSSILRSSNYIAGVSGWQIDGGGDVEFDSGTFRGDIIADSFATNVAGARILIDNGSLQTLRFFSGDVNEVNPATILATVDGGNEHLLYLQSPDSTLSGNNAVLRLISHEAGDTEARFDADVVMISGNELAFGSGNDTISFNETSNQFDFGADGSTIFQIDGTAGIRATTENLYLGGGLNMRLQADVSLQGGTWRFFDDGLTEVARIRGDFNGIEIGATSNVSRLGFGLNTNDAILYDDAANTFTFAVDGISGAGFASSQVWVSSGGTVRLEGANSNSYLQYNSSDVIIVVDSDVAARFDGNGVSVDTGERFAVDGNGGNDYMDYDSGNSRMRWVVGGSTRFSVTNSGDFRVFNNPTIAGTTAVINASSSQLARTSSTPLLKTDREPIGDSLHDAFMSVEAVGFNWKNRHPITGQKHSVGHRLNLPWGKRRHDYSLMTDELSESIPELVWWAPMGRDHEVVQEIVENEDGTTTRTSRDVRTKKGEWQPDSLNLQGIVGVLWAELQHAHRRIDELSDMLERPLAER